MHNLGISFWLLAFSSVKVVVMRCAAAKDVVRKLYGFVGLKLKEVFSFGRIVARPARYVRETFHRRLRATFLMLNV